MDETRLARFIHPAGWNVVRDKLTILLGCLLVVSAWLVWPRQPVAHAPPVATFAPVKPAQVSLPITLSVATVNIAPVPPEDLPALIRARLQAWDDDDNPALRAARLQELDTLLAHSDVFAVLQTLPSNLMGYAFATPTVQQKLIADPQATLDWMSAHTNTQSQLLTLLHDWGQTNREAMQHYLTDLPAGDWREKALLTAANEALSADPATSINMAVQMEPRPATIRLVGHGSKAMGRERSRGGRPMGRSCRRSQLAHTIDLLAGGWRGQHGPCPGRWFRSTSVAARSRIESVAFGDRLDLGVAGPGRSRRMDGAIPARRMAISRTGECDERLGKPRCQCRHDLDRRTAAGRLSDTGGPGIVVHIERACSIKASDTFKTL